MASLCSRRSVATHATLSLIMWLVAPPAKAFNYPEHAHISARAIQLVVEEGDLAAGAGSPSSSPVRTPREVLQSAASLLDCCHTCKEAWFLAAEPQGCLALSDLPALSGDHAGSPLLLKWRWFNAALLEIPPRSLVRSFPGVLYGLLLGWQGPEAVRQARPEMPSFVQFMRQYRFTAGVSSTQDHLAPGVVPGDKALQRLDDSYLELAERNRPHFRPPLQTRDGGSASMEEVFALASERYTYTHSSCRRAEANPHHKPALNAHAWYADLHMGALRFAGLAARHSGEDKRFFEGMAVFFEMTALHFLEDSVAAGHMMCDARELNSGTVLAVHNHYGELGIEALMGEPLCQAAKSSVLRRSIFPRLNEACRSGDRKARIYGDHVFSRGLQDAALTEEWAVLIAAHSLAQVAQRALAPVPPGPEDALAGCRKHELPPDEYKAWAVGEANGFSTSDVDQPFYRCAFHWWESQEPAARRSNEIQEAAARGDLSALSLMPMPTAEELDDLIVFSGLGLSLSPGGSYGFSGPGKETARLQLGVGGTLVLPPLAFPIQVRAEALFSHPLSSESNPRSFAGLRLLPFLYWSSSLPLFSGGYFDAGYLWARQGSGGSFGGGVYPVGIKLRSRNSFMMEAALSTGCNTRLGCNLGFQLHSAFGL